MSALPAPRWPLGFPHSRRAAASWPDRRSRAPELERRLSVAEVEERPGESSGRERPGPWAAPAPSVPVESDPRNGPFAVRRIGTAPIIVLAGLLGLVMVIVGGTLCAQNWTRGNPWTPRLLMLVSSSWSSTLLAMGVGLWWWWRAPANPTGWLLYLAGVGDCSFMISRSWPSPWAQLVGLLGFLQLPCLALIVFGWPTGRPSRRLRTAVIVYTLSVAAIFQVGFVFTKSAEPSAEWPDPWQATFSIPEVWYLMDAFQALVLNAVPAIATIIWLVRRRRAVPPAVRPLITPITAAGVAVAASLVLVHFGFQVFGSLFGGDENDISAASLVVLLADYCHGGFIAIGVLVAATRRQRAVAVGTRQMLVELRSATPVVSPSAAAAAIVGDPTARVRYRAPGGGWIDSAGAGLEDIGPERRSLPVFDGTGEMTACLEVDASTPVPPLLADLAVSAIAARAANERATALADARRRDVRARDRARTSRRRASARAVARSFAARAAMVLTARSASNGGTGVDASTSRQAVISPVPSNTGNNRRSGPMSSRPAPALSIQPPPGARYRTLAVGSPTMAAAAADGLTTGVADRRSTSICLVPTATAR